MLQKAIIEKKIDKYLMKVRIPVYNKIKSDPTATPTEDLYTAIIQTLPGCSPVYQEGDLVLVEFENDDIANPVIIGLLYRQDMLKGSTDIVADSLHVNVNTTLSENTSIGYVTPESIKKLDDKYTNNVKKVVVEYSLSNYQDHYDQFSQWSEQAPQYWPEKYMWQRTTVTYENGLVTRSMTCIQGAEGQPGTGITIITTYVKYAINSSGTTHPSTSDTWYENPPQTTDVSPYLWSWTYVLYSDGTSTDTFNVSKTGANTLIVYLYKRSDSVISHIDWSNTLTYDFDTKQFISLPTGWSSDIPAGNDPIYVTAATVSSVRSQGTIPYTGWSSPILFTKSGFNSKTIQLYKRAASIPSVPVSDVTYTFSNGSISPASPNGWSIAVPTTDGNPCYVIQSTAISYEDTDTILSSEWSAPTILAQDGASDYIDENIIDWYIATTNTTTPTTPTTDIEISSEWTTLGWTNDISSITLSETNKYLWNAEVTHYTLSGYIKTNPHIITIYGEGSAGKGISSISEYYALSTTTTRPSSGWSTNLPTMDATNRYLWNYSVITYTDGTSSGSQSDALIIGVYGDSVISVEIQSNNGTLFNSKTLSTTLTPFVYIGSTELSVSDPGGVVSNAGTVVGQINWTATERFKGNGQATTFDLGLDILNSSSSNIHILINGTETTSFSIQDQNTIIFSTAPADNSIIEVEYITSTNKSITIDRTDVRNQIVIRCSVVSTSSTLTFSEITIKDLNDATSLRTWYMLTVDNPQAVTVPTVVYNSDDYSVEPTGSYSYEDSSSTQRTENFTWFLDSPVINESTVNKICYSFQMIVFSDGSCSAGEVDRDSSFDFAISSYLQALAAGQTAQDAQTTANHADAVSGQNTQELAQVNSTLTSINGVLNSKLDSVVFTPYKDNIDAFISFDIPNSTMTLGKGNFKQELTATKNSFKDGSTEVAYISNQELYINKTTVNSQLAFDSQWIITFDTTNGLVVKHM